MGYRLGVDLGTTYTAAAYVEDQAPRMLELGNRNVSVPSVLFVTEGGGLLFGEAAERRAGAEPERVIREFKRRFGDPVPMVVGQHSFDAVQLQTELLRWVLRSAAERQAAAPEHVVVTYPANWGPFKLQLMQTMITQAGVPGASLCPEPVAAAIEYAAKSRVPIGARLAVYDLGGGTFDVAVLEKTDTGFAILGTPLGIEHLGGSDFDEAVFSETLARLGVADVDLDDPVVARELNTLRRGCIEAKESLSSDVETEISSLLPGTQRAVRWSRKEFQALIRPALADTVATTARALQLANVSPPDVHAVVLVGGSSRIPLVTEMLAGELGVRVALDTYPKNDISMGAARYSLHPGASGASITETGSDPGGRGLVATAGAPWDGPPVPSSPQAASEAVDGPVHGAAQSTEGPTFPETYPAAAMPGRTPDSAPPVPAGVRDDPLTPPGPVPAWMATGPSAPPAIDGPDDSAPSPTTRRLVVLLVIGIVVVALGITAGFVINRLRGSETAGPIVASTAQPTVGSTPPPTVSPSPSPTPAAPPNPEEFGLPVGKPISTGQLIAPLMDKAGQPAHLALIDVDSGRTRELNAPSAGSLYGIGLSKDRRTITYVDRGINSVRTMAAAGGKGRLLFRSPKGCGTIAHASWSPTDLSTFVLECQVGEGPKRLVVVRIDGSIVVELDTGQKQSADPSISPDGTDVAFWGASTLDKGEGGSIFVMPIDGSAPPRAVTSGGAGVDADPAWSPGGESLAFRHVAKAGSDNFDVMVVAAAGGTSRPLLTGPALDEKPTWSPDGSEIVAVSNRDADGKATSTRDLWRVAAAGGDPVPLDVRTHRISTPTWWHR
jgi:actin-like ATPase involved in cell morphogenesis